ncbi:hypothetical protein [Nocardia goodfellowii]|uniref:Uncharacterized protein n=1 Tax=Nocardia goodfellowii TaxID=882446 RepID=A0ABS4QEL7_9NOCA|nr:hypothetical protein [Nocardia goodfellowii]MBP2189131.1 hypothetical protein [Nocardia goodfellowii]
MRRERLPADGTQCLGGQIFQAQVPVHRHDQVGLHSVADVLRFETWLAPAHPELVVTLRHDKLLGRVLDPQGRSIAVVAPDIWSDPGGRSARVSGG